MSRPENTSYHSVNKRCHRLLVSQRAVQSAAAASHVLSAILCTQVLSDRDLQNSGKQVTGSPLSVLLSVKISDPVTQVITGLLSLKVETDSYAETRHLINRLLNIQINRQDLPSCSKQTKNSKNFNNEVRSKIDFLGT